MNLSDPKTSKELASLMQTRKMRPLERTQFLRAAYKAKNMESFKKDFISGAIYNEPVPRLSAK